MCKWLCIIGYVLAALGSIVLSFNQLYPQKQINVPKPIIGLYLIGGLATMFCAVRWALNKEGSSITA